MWYDREKHILWSRCIWWNSCKQPPKQMYRTKSNQPLKRSTPQQQLGWLAQLLSFCSLTPFCITEEWNFAGRSIMTKRCYTPNWISFFFLFLRHSLHCFYIHMGNILLVGRRGYLLFRLPQHKNRTGTHSTLLVLLALFDKALFSSFKPQETKKIANVSEAGRIDWKNPIVELNRKYSSQRDRWLKETCGGTSKLSWTFLPSFIFLCCDNSNYCLPVAIKGGNRNLQYRGQKLYPLLCSLVRIRL